MGLKSEDSKPYEEQLYSERKLRPKTLCSNKTYDLHDSSDEENEENSYKISIINV